MRLIKSRSFVILLVLLMVNSYAFADTQYQADFVGSIESFIPNWMNVSTAAAIKIFTILWCFETFYQVAFKNVLGNNLRQLPVYFITRVCFGGFFYTFLLKPDVYLGIIQFFGSLSTPVTIQGDLIKGFDAGWIFRQFKSWTTLVYNPSVSQLGINEIGKLITYGIMYDVYMVCSCAIGIMVIILEVQIYMTVFGALVLTGFAGSSWTYGIWNRYIDAIIGLGLRVMVFGMLYGILSKLVGVSDLNAPALTIADSTVSIILVTACLWIIPSTISHMVSGSAAGHSLAEAGATIFATMALGRRMMTKIPGNSMSGAITGNRSSSPSYDPTIPRTSFDNMPNPAKSKPVKPMPPNWKG